MLNIYLLSAVTVTVILVTVTILSVARSIQLYGCTTKWTWRDLRCALPFAAVFAATESLARWLI